MRFSVRYTLLFLCFAARYFSQDTLSLKTGNIKLNVNLGTVLNDNFINKPYNDWAEASRRGTAGESETFTPFKKSHINVGFNFGVNMTLGKSPVCKFIAGLNFLQSIGDFQYLYKKSESYESHHVKKTYRLEANYNSTVYFININAGLRLTLFKRISIDNCISFNVPVSTTNKISGYESTTNYPDNYYTYIYYQQTPPDLETSINTFNEKITHDSKVKTTVSFHPKISYEFKMRETRAGIYYSYNIAYRYNLPWHCLGIVYYPFKKLR
ncbi:MAG: hypothetical protein K0S53_3349 [Bacteroidetes bacterium]|jgi:hypothetical protein|nr:hypothetical protein [Bacteroidota bacterium]MDF2451426.1 hypothetical protein [Bacteroidota bacterium]